VACYQSIDRGASPPPSIVIQRQTSLVAFDRATPALCVLQRQFWLAALRVRAVKISAPRLMGKAFPGMTMAEEWWLAILLLLFGALFLVGLVTEAQLSCDEKRRSRGMVPDPDKVRVRRHIIG
jgi:hypothetical protein